MKSPHRYPGKVAIIHYWLVGMRGGERVLEVLCDMFPDADIFTHVYNPDKISTQISKHTIYKTSISKLPFPQKLYQSYLPLMPSALEALDLSEYDLVISSEAGPAKGVIAPIDAPHICYCHSPMRYVWDQYGVYKKSAGKLANMMMPIVSPQLRQWDVTSSARVDQIVANSSHVAKRIEKYWRRSSEVVHPPVAVEDFAPVPADEVGDFYLWAGELVSYKRPDIVIDAFNEMGKKLVVIGGPEKTERKLQERAKDNITFLGKVPFEELKQYMARCKALVFPGEEDFGMVPVEVMASGRPVIAYARGGATETVVDGKTGLLFKNQSVEGLVSAIERFERAKLDQLDPNVLVEHAQKFNKQNFINGMSRVFADQGILPQFSSGDPFDSSHLRIA